MQPPGQPIQTNRPTNKTIGATAGSALGSALGIILNWVLNTYVVGAAHPIPDQVQGAITVVVTAAVTFALGYFVPPGDRETVMVTPEGPKTALH